MVLIMTREVFRVRERMACGCGVQEFFSTA